MRNENLVLFAKSTVDLIPKVGIRVTSSTAREDEKEVISTILKAKTGIPGAHTEARLFVIYSRGTGSQL